MKLAEPYEYCPMVARGILCQLRTFGIENNKVMEDSIADAEDILRPYLNEALMLSLVVGDSANESIGYSFPFVYGETIQKDTPETLAKLNQTQQELEEIRRKEENLRQEIARVEKENEDRIRETEQYKKSLVEIKQQLGRSSISLNTIAECILRFPSFDLQYNAFQQIGSILVGTPWSYKAHEVLEAMFKMVNREKKKTVINIKNFTNSGTVNEVHDSVVAISPQGQQIQQNNVGQPKPASPESLAPSQVHLNTKRSTKLNFFRVIKALCDQGFFVDASGANPADCAFLLSPEGQQSLVDLHVDSICDYISQISI